MLLKNKELYEFGEFRLDVEEHTLTRSDGLKNGQLPEKAFQTLIILVRNSGRLLTKQELIDQIWPDSFVEENNLDKCVHAIRHVLGEKPGEQKFIETVRKHGYRFVATVNTLETPLEEPASLLDSEFLTEPTTFKTHSRPTISTATTESGAFVVSAKWNLEDDGKIVHENGNSDQKSTQPALEPKGTSGTVKRSIVVPILLLAGVATMIYFTIVRPTDSTAVGGTKSIAVLPFRPVNTANRDELYEIGIADSLINRLSSTGGFLVRPLSAVRRYANLELDPIAAGHEQNVDYVLAPYYQVADGKIRITAQLIDVATGRTEQSYDFAKDVSGVFALQDAVADELRNILAAKFGAGPGGPPTKRGTDNEEAYRLYHLAMTLVAKGGPVNIEAAIAYLDKAVALDPNYARAWAGKAYAHTRNVWDPRGIPHREQIPKSLDAVTKALSIDPDLSEAHTVLCENRLFFEYDFDGAETACRRAVELNPNSSVAHLASGRLLISRGRFDEAFAESKTAMELDPASFVIQRQYANVLYASRRYLEAEEQYKRAISLNAEEVGPYDRLIRTLEAQGKESEAFDCLIRWYEIRKEAPETIEGLKAAYAASGWRGAVAELIRTIEARKIPNHYALADWYAALGNKDKAFENLEKAYQERNLNMPFIRVGTHHFDSLRDDPRFADLVRRIEGK
jgi:DNA-binding winged helix-turn-helix (wHTH) protein/TolB-like protein/Tfp pilus assembly protein PilF